MKFLTYEEKMLSLKEVSDVLNVSLITVKRYVSDGKLNSIKVGNVRRVDPKDLKNLQNSNPKKNKGVKEVKIIPGYMGIKTQILNLIKLEIERIAKKGGVILDIFSGSGAVAYSLKKDFIVYANDVEPFSFPINKLLLDGSLKKEDIERLDLKKIDSDYAKNISALHEAASEIDLYKKDHKKFPYILFSRYFSNTYFGLEQSRQIDSLRYAIDQVTPEYKNLLLSCLIYACYQTVSSVGSHFAQPKKESEKNSGAIVKKRNLDVKKYFLNKLEEIKENLYVNEEKNEVFCEEFKTLLNPQGKHRKLLENVSVTYIDPPYTIDHYSRFYHILNTLVLYDYPEKIGNGLYREDRYQSNFCIKSRAYQELDDLVSRLAALRSKIVMSYSDGYRVLLNPEQILEIFSKYYKPQSIKTPTKIEYSYSGFGQSASNKAHELLFIATEPK